MAEQSNDREIFDRQGFVGPFRLYQPDEARAIIKEVRAKNSDTSNNLYASNPVNYDRHFDIPELTRHIVHPEIVKRLQLILGQNILCWRTEWFPKFPGSEGTEWHAVRDYSYASGVAQIEPTEERQDSFFDLTAWTTFTPSTKETGCMKFIPGSHKRNLFDERKNVKTGRTEGYNAMAGETQFFGYKFAEFKVDPTWDPDSEEVVPMEMDAGECVIFTARCVHGSYPNSTQRKTRFAITARYVPTHVRVYADQESFMAHGTRHDLRDFGVVLAAGKDTYGHNRIRHISNRGEWFPRPEGVVNVAELSAFEISRQVERVWRKVLNVDKVGLEEDFFDELGGHSLLVHEVKAQLEKVFNRVIPTDALFRQSTVNALAGYLRESFQAPGEAPIEVHTPCRSSALILPEGPSVVPVGEPPALSPAEQP
jgi:non-heme Fe2+,alpha-ketoglutarate-dependent halogenase